MLMKFSLMRGIQLNLNGRWFPISLKITKQQEIQNSIYAIPIIIFIFIFFLALNTPNPALILTMGLILVLIIIAFIFLLKNSNINWEAIAMVKSIFIIPVFVFLFIIFLGLNSPDPILMLIIALILGTLIIIFIVTWSQFSEHAINLSYYQQYTITISSDNDSNVSFDVKMADFIDRIKGQIEFSITNYFSNTSESDYNIEIFTSKNIYHQLYATFKSI